ncbi:MAG TPA: hypothetical protein VHW65_03395 [Gemmatimonadales bacterium]|nr:hypothetical protein [Gemmatimonadales bacterium]
MIAVLYLLFFLSGAAGLMYESIWTRYLGLFAGHQAYAQILVLVIFLGGMSLGAALVARRAATVRDPLKWYAIVEALVGVIGFAFHPVFVVVTGWAYDHAFPATAGGVLFPVVKWGLAALLILPQSILLGTTFPLMSAGVLRRAPAQPGRVLGWLYFTNSLGAAIGVLVAGFWLVDLFGLPGVLHSAGTLNLVVATGAALVMLRRRIPLPTTSSGLKSQVSGLTSHISATPDREWLLLGAAFFTAIASFCYEIDWVRMLSLVLGSATRSFELMLSAFILGLALGAFWIRRRGDDFRDPLLALAIIQLVMGFLAIATLPLYLASFHGTEVLLTGLAHNAAGYFIYNVSRYALCLAVMLPATCCAGMTLPLITATMLARGRGESAIGQVYAVNTLGSITGVALAGLVLLPVLGLEKLLIVGGVIDMIVGLVILNATAQRHSIWRAAGAAAVATGAIAVTTHFAPLLLTSGVFRGRSIAFLQGSKVIYYADGRTATVSVTESETGFRSIATNGKVDASAASTSRAPCDSSAPRRTVGGDEVTQILTGLLPLGYAHHGGSAAVFGIGSGTSSHMVLADPAWHDVTTIEIEPRMIDGARFFLPINQRTFSDPRSHVIVDDAKAYFAASGRQWDLIVSEPSNPWVKGVSGLFTEEFYRRLRSHLAPGGVFAQWLQGYELDDQLVLSVLAALNKVFPDWRVHQVGSADLLFVASRDGALPPPDWDRVAALPSVQRDFCNIVPLDGHALEATLVADRALLLPVILRVPRVNSDFYPVLDLQAERRRFEGTSGDGLLTLGDQWFNLGRALINARQAPLTTLDAPFDDIRRQDDRVRQSWQTRSAIPDSGVDANIAATRFAWARWNAAIDHDETPVDWHSWNQEFIAVAQTRHAGTAGWIDSSFFARAERFAAAHAAPVALRATLAFRRGVQAWDGSTTLAAAQEINDGGGVNAGWITAQEVADGAVVAALRRGDGALALYWWNTEGRSTARADQDPRSLLLASRIADLTPRH